MTIQDLQQERRELDKEFWNNKETIDVWTRHVLDHLEKLVEKLAAFSEERKKKVNASDAVVRTEVIPDLLGYALQLGNLFEVDVEDAYHRRQKEVKEKIEQR